MLIPPCSGGGQWRSPRCGRHVGFRSHVCRCGPVGRLHRHACSGLVLKPPCTYVSHCADRAFLYALRALLYALVIRSLGELTQRGTTRGRPAADGIPQPVVVQECARFQRCNSRHERTRARRWPSSVGAATRVWLQLHCGLGPSHRPGYSAVRAPSRRGGRGSSSALDRTPALMEIRLNHPPRKYTGRCQPSPPQHRSPPGLRVVSS